MSFDTFESRLVDKPLKMFIDLTATNSLMGKSFSPIMGTGTNGERRVTGL